MLKKSQNNQTKIVLHTYVETKNENIQFNIYLCIYIYINIHLSMSICQAFLRLVLV